MTVRKKQPTNKKTKLKAQKQSKETKTNKYNLSDFHLEELV